MNEKKKEVFFYLTFMFVACSRPFCARLYVCVRTMQPYTTYTFSPEPKHIAIQRGLQKKNIVHIFTKPVTSVHWRKKGIYVRQFLAHKRILLVVSHGFLCVLRCLRRIWKRYAHLYINIYQHNTVTLCFLWLLYKKNIWTTRIRIQTVHTVGVSRIKPFYSQTNVVVCSIASSRH